MVALGLKVALKCMSFFMGIKHILYRYRRRLAKGFKSVLHLLIEDEGIDHRSGEV